jgi:hypothetical protein
MNTIKIHLEVILYPQQPFVMTCFLKLCLLHKQPQAHGNACFYLAQGPLCRKGGDAGPITRALGDPTLLLLLWFLL